MTQSFRPINDILKATGERQRFSSRKFESSLERAGASKNLAQKIAQEVQQQKLRSTNEIHAYALRKLKKKYRPIAGRYNMKRAIMKLGPSGYPFEQFVGALLKAKGYQVRVNKIVKGFCVNHEVDVIARKDDRHIFIECKFHNQPGIRSNVKIPLYIKARVDDLVAQFHHIEKNDERHEGWIVTNTEFTRDALQYGQCNGLKLVSWDMPKNDNLSLWIDETGLHPISALTYLTQKQKEQLMKKNILLCRDVKRKKHVLKSIGVPSRKIERVVREAQAICQLRDTLE